MQVVGEDFFGEGENKSSFKSSKMQRKIMHSALNCHSQKMQPEPKKGKKQQNWAAEVHSPWIITTSMGMLIQKYTLKYI